MCEFFWYFKDGLTRTSGETNQSGNRSAKKAHNQGAQRAAHREAGCVPHTNQTIVRLPPADAATFDIVTEDYAFSCRRLDLGALTRAWHAHYLQAQDPRARDPAHPYLLNGTSRALARPSASTLTVANALVAGEYKLVGAEAERATRAVCLALTQGPDDPDSFDAGCGWTPQLRAQFRDAPFASLDASDDRHFFWLAFALYRLVHDPRQRTADSLLWLTVYALHQAGDSGTFPRCDTIRISGLADLQGFFTKVRLVCFARSTRHPLIRLCTALPGAVEVHLVRGEQRAGTAHAPQSASHQAHDRRPPLCACRRARHAPSRHDPRASPVAREHGAQGVGLA